MESDFESRLAEEGRRRHQENEKIKVEIGDVREEVRGVTQSVRNEMKEFDQNMTLALQKTACGTQNSRSQRLMNPSRR